MSPGHTQDLNNNNNNNNNQQQPTTTTTATTTTTTATATTTTTATTATAATTTTTPAATTQQQQRQQVQHLYEWNSHHYNVQLTRHLNMFPNHHPLTVPSNLIYVKLLPKNKDHEKRIGVPIIRGVP